MQQESDGWVISNPFEHAGYASIAAESDEDIHVVWHDNVTGTYQLYYNRISGDLFQIWETAQQVTESPGDAMYPSIALDTKGNIHVVWQDNRYGHWDIYYVKLDNTGYALIDEERVTDDPGDSIQPDITLDDAGDVQITWYDDRNGDYDLFWDKRIEPELTLINLTLTPEKPMQDDITNVSITLQNKGNNTASDVHIAFFIDDVVQEEQIVSAEATSEQIVSFEWTAEYGTHELKIQVDPENVIAETDEENNIETFFVRVYDTTDFSNVSIWADATIQHTVDVAVTIEGVNDPNASGTPNHINKFVDYEVDTYFDTALIRIGYTQNDLGDVMESSLQMYYWDVYDAEGQRWVLIEDSGVNTDENYVWANVSQFSVFAPLGVIQQNQPPETPSTPDGLTEVYAEYEWDYSTSTTDPEEHLIFYKWDFGDEITDWLGPYDSGEIATWNHIWDEPGEYAVSVKAKDQFDAESDWSDSLQVTVKKPGDIDGNGVVNVIDLLELLASWGEPSGPADINGDGTVNVVDLLILLANWG